MSITVYTVSGAPRGWRVLLGLTFKGIDHNIKLLQASQQEHKSPAYLKIHPRGTIPALDADGLVLRDSIGILAWLDRQHPEQPLFGETASDAARIWQIVMESNDYLRTAINDVLAPLLVQGKPLPKPGTPDHDAFQSSAQTLRDECQLLENHLHDSRFLAGDFPTAADAVCFPEVRLIERAVATKKDDMNALGLASMSTDFPHLEAWKKRVTGMPGVDKTMPAHWS